MQDHSPRGRVLIIAGSDSGGGAGIQGDIKTVTALRGYAATAITALTAQNTQGVQEIWDIPAIFVRRQMEAVLEDIGADAFKTGMLHRADIIEAVADTIASYPPIPLILDPVMIAKGGAPLLQRDAVSLLKDRLIPLATLLTPNVPEAEHLADMPIRNADDVQRAAGRILRLGCDSVLIKGGHMTGETVEDRLVTATHTRLFEHPRQAGNHTHGTGCALASAIATGLAQGLPLEESIARAQRYVGLAITHAPGLGKGHGPLGHNHTVNEFN